MYGLGRWDASVFRHMLQAYQNKYPRDGIVGFDYLATLDCCFPGGRPVLETARCPGETDRLDDHILLNSPICLYVSKDVMGEDLGRLQSYGYAAHRFDCSHWHDEQDFHAEVGRALDFPGYYGHNLSAFSDCLCGAAVQPGDGMALVFFSFDSLYKRSPGWSWDVLNIIAVVSRRLLLMGRRLLALVQSDDRDINVNPVGAQPVCLNPKEFLRNAH